MLIFPILITVWRFWTRFIIGWYPWFSTL